MRAYASPEKPLLVVEQRDTQLDNVQEVSVFGALSPKWNYLYQPSSLQARVYVQKGR